MARKKDEKVTISFLNNGTSVTGSCTIIKFLNRTILFECGGIQEGHTPLENYRLNKNQMCKIKPKDIDMVIVGHGHYDHQGNIPYLIKNNKNIKILIPKNTKDIMKEMWIDSANISERDCEMLSQKYEKIFTPLYDLQDVEETYKRIQECDSGEIIQIDENVSLRYINAGHIYGSMQCELFIKIKNHTHKILFTSDLGNTKIEQLKPFVEKFTPVNNCNIVIGETTYGSKINKPINEKSINKDLEKIKSVIKQFCGEYKRRVLIPIFSLDKCPNMLWIIYNMFKDEKDFDTKIVIDSPLTNRLIDRYEEVLTDEAKSKFKEMMVWENIIRIVDPNESKKAIQNLNNVVILSSGGMLQSGRSVKWAKSILPCYNDCILLCGYCGEGTLGWKIKNYKEQKTISINGTPTKNKCQIVNLKSFSSHMQREQLLDYYSNINANKIYLVHGEMDGKIEFANDLKDIISKKSKTTKVTIVNKDTTINL